MRFFFKENKGKLTSIYKCLWKERVTSFVYAIFNIVSLCQVFVLIYHDYLFPKNRKKIAYILSIDKQGDFGISVFRFFKDLCMMFFYRIHEKISFWNRREIKNLFPLLLGTSLNKPKNLWIDLISMDYLWRKASWRSRC